MNDVWPYFEWTSPQLEALAGILNTALTHRYEQYKKWQENDQADCEQRALAKDWAHELRRMLQTWSSLFEIDAESVTAYSAAHYVFMDLVPIEGTAANVISTFCARFPNGDAVFRPACLERANREIMTWLRKHPSDVDRVHDRTFEAIIAEVIASAGWNVELTKRTRDGGRDLICLKNDTLGFPLLMIVEAKRYASSRGVGLPMVDRLIGVASRSSPHKAVLVTNSYFTDPAWKHWEHRVGRDLEFVEREELLQWLQSYGAQGVAHA